MRKYLIPRIGPFHDPVHVHAKTVIALILAFAAKIEAAIVVPPQGWYDALAGQGERFSNEGTPVIPNTYSEGFASDLFVISLDNPYHGSNFSIFGGNAEISDGFLRLFPGGAVSISSRHPNPDAKLRAVGLSIDSSSAAEWGYLFGNSHQNIFQGIQGAAFKDTFLSSYTTNLNTFTTLWANDPSGIRSIPRSSNLVISTVHVAYAVPETSIVTIAFASTLLILFRRKRF